MLFKLMMVDKSSTPSITYMYNVSVGSQAFVITLHAQYKSDCKQLKVYQCVYMCASKYGFNFNCVTKVNCLL